MHDKHKPLQVLIILVFAFSLMSPSSTAGGSCFCESTILCWPRLRHRRLNSPYR